MNKADKINALKTKGVVLAVDTTASEVNRIYAEHFTSVADDGQQDSASTTTTNDASATTTNDASASADTINGALQKLIDAESTITFNSEAARTLLRTQKEREFPSFGGNIPEGTVLTFSGYGTSHAWKSPRTGNTSNILTAYCTNAAGEIFEVPFASFCRPAYPFVRFDGRNADGVPQYATVTQTFVLPNHYDSGADRNAAVMGLQVGLQFTIHHARGHFDNPYATRVWDFLTTWCSPIE